MAKILGAALGNIPWQEKPEGCKYPSGVMTATPS